MRVCVTGGAGFIGSHLVDVLIEEGHKVLVLDNLSTGNRKNINSKSIFKKIDIHDNRVYKILMEFKPEAIYHLAAQVNILKSIDDPVSDAFSNVIGTVKLLKYSIDIKIKRFIFSSTGGALYGDGVPIPTPEMTPPNPSSPYGLSKATCEHYIKLFSRIYGLRYTILRYSNVYGPRQSANGEYGIIARLCKTALKDKKPVEIYGDGSQTKDFIFIDDVTRANLLFLKNDIIGEYNISSGVETSINTLIDTVKEIIGHNIEKKSIMMPKCEQRRTCLSFRKLQEQIGWSPTIGLVSGLRKTLSEITLLSS